MPHRKGGGAGGRGMGFGCAAGRGLRITLSTMDGSGSSMALAVGWKRAWVAAVWSAMAAGVVVLPGCGGSGEVEVRINQQNSVVLPGTRLREPPLAQDVAKGRVLLQQLASGRKKVQNLTTEERRILNRLDRTLASMEEEK